MGKTWQTWGELWPKNFFLTNAKFSCEVLQGNQWYHEMRLVILQLLLGVSGSQLKTGGSFGPKSVCHLSHVQSVPWGRWSETHRTARCAWSLRIFVAGSGAPAFRWGDVSRQRPAWSPARLEKKGPSTPLGYVHKCEDDNFTWFHICSSVYDSFHIPFRSLTVFIWQHITIWQYVLRFLRQMISLTSSLLLIASLATSTNGLRPTNCLWT